MNDITTVMNERVKQLSEYIESINEKTQKWSPLKKIIIFCAGAFFVYVAGSHVLHSDRKAYEYVYNTCYYRYMTPDRDALHSFCKKMANCVSQRISMEDLMMIDLGVSNEEVLKAMFKCGQKYTHIIEHSFLMSQQDIDRMLKSMRGAM